MNNTYFILSKTKLSIDRFHICTWDYLDFNAAIEIGIEFTPVPPNIKTIDFKGNIGLPLSACYYYLLTYLFHGRKFLKKIKKIFKK